MKHPNVSSSLRKPRSAIAPATSFGDHDMKYAVFTAAAAVTLISGAPASAGEVFVGVAAHEVDTPFTLKTHEQGADIQFGYRGDRIEGLKAIGAPSPYVFGSVNSSGDTSFAAAGLSWKIGKTLYVRPAIGLALHDGRIPRAGPAGRRIDLGSRVLFEPELGLGYQLTKSVSIEASWAHISNARILSKQNPGIDMIGIRANLRL
jgi:lipid A 3-O-deacylase